MTADKALAVYGKSFHWARRFLGQHTGMKAAQLYQFCRVLDDMADGDIQHGPQRLGGGEGRRRGRRLVAERGG